MSPADIATAVAGALLVFAGLWQFAKHAAGHVAVPGDHPNGRCCICGLDHVPPALQPLTTTPLEETR